MTYHFQIPPPEETPGFASTITINDAGTVGFGQNALNLIQKMPEVLKEASAQARAAWVNGITGIPYTIIHENYKGFKISENGGKLTGYSETQTAIGYTIAELHRMIDYMTEPGDSPEPDYDNQAREWEEDQRWNDAPTPYDP